MNDQEFLSFINTNTTRGGCTFNLTTQNCSKQAQAKLATTQYKSLAKQHISGNVKNGYYNNAKFKDKITQVMEELGITIIA